MPRTLVMTCLPCWMSVRLEARWRFHLFPVGEWEEEEPRDQGHGREGEKQRGTGQEARNEATEDPPDRADTIDDTDGHSSIMATSFGRSDSDDERLGSIEGDAEREQVDRDKPPVAHHGHQLRPQRLRRRATRQHRG